MAFVRFHPKLMTMCSLPASAITDWRRVKYNNDQVNVHVNVWRHRKLTIQVLNCGPPVSVLGDLIQLK